MPKFDKNDERLFLGFFNTGAYQDALSGYGGIKHCLIPSPKRILIDKDADGNLIDWCEAEEQDAASMLKILGY
jgi:arginine decarboxylase